MFGMNGFESFRGGQFNYKFKKLNIGVNYGSGPTFSKKYNLASVSIGSNQDAENTTFYGAHYQNKADSISISHFVDVQRVKKSEKFNTGQILALTHKDSTTDGSIQLIFDILSPKYKITSRSYFIGLDFDDDNKGRKGSDLTSNINFKENLYNFSRIQIYEQDLYETTPIYKSDEFRDCGIDQICYEDPDLFDSGENNGEFDIGEEITVDLNDDNIYSTEIDTTFIEKVLVTDFNDKIFFQFNNGLRLNTGYNYRYNLFSDGQYSERKEFDFRLIKSFDINSMYLSTKVADEMDIDNDQYSSLRIEMGNRSTFENLSMNINQTMALQTYGPIDSLTNSSPVYKTSFDARFQAIKLNWNFNLILDNLCPLCTGKEEKSRISALSLSSGFGLNILGVKNQIRLGIGYIGSNFVLTFGFTPSGGSRSSKIRIPVPLIKIKGRYQGEIFVDNNSNGFRDVNEHGIPDVMLFINGDYTVTNENGEFEFGALDPGRYNLSYNVETLDPKYKFTENFPYAVTITKGSKDFDSFPVSPVCKIKGALYIDSDLDKTRDLNEKVIDNARLIVQDSENNEKIIYTDAKGRFEISDLKMGTYNFIVDPEWLPERTVVTNDPESKKMFTKLGWPIEVTDENSIVTFDIPINEEELKIRIDVKNDNNDGSR